MPNNAQKRSQGYTEQVRFVEISLTADVKVKVSKDSDFRENYLSTLNSLCESGYRLVAKTDERTKGVMVTCQNTDKESEDADVIYVCRASTAAKALIYTLYAYAVIGDGMFPVNEDSPDEGMDEFPW